MMENAVNRYNVYAILSSWEGVKDLSLSQKDAGDILAPLSDSNGF